MPNGNTYTKEIICLANSRKKSGRCVAGREIKGNSYGDWIRPVSARTTEELSEEERQYANGQDPSLLEIILVPFSGAYPHSYQTENHIIDPNFHWELKRRASWTEVQGAVEKFSGPLWVNGHSSYNGENDRVPESIVANQTRSLYLIQPTLLNVIVIVEGAAFQNARRKVRAKFEHNGFQYKLALTDPVAEREFLAKNDGEYPVSQALLCISLGEVHNDYAYKLVAGLITPDRASAV